MLEPSSSYSLLPRIEKVLEEGGTKRDFYCRWLELPLFNGIETLDWVLRVERYFDVNGLTKREWLTVVGICMKGDALHWLQWRENDELSLVGRNSRRRCSDTFP